jgi:hypothetical protein
MKALEKAVDLHQRSNLQQRCESLLDRAEQIKSTVQWPPTLTPSPLDLSHLSLRPTTSPDRSHFTTPTSHSRSEPRPSREPSRTERIIILRNSKLHGFKFAPWETPPDGKTFKCGNNFPDIVYVDSPDLRLSEKQLASFASWNRAEEALPPPSLLVGGGPVTMHSDQSTDLVQDVATDCSVVASLCAAVAREEKGHTRILFKTIYPHDSIREEPLMSENGKYVIRLNFNGCYRSVTIDDRLPTSKTHRILHVIDRNNPSLLWPALLEKAYLKARGGYDFPGSNPGTDLWVLLGWIPDQVFLQDEETDINSLWKSIVQNFDQGDLLVTAGTGAMSRRTERGLDLASKHAYAVVDLREDGHQRLLLLKNPWCEGNALETSFRRGKATSTSSSDNLDELFALEYGQNNFDTLPPSNMPTRAGTFWMDLNKMLQHFDSLYLNWNPAIFDYREDIHFTWKCDTVGGTTGSLVCNPQFSVTSAGGHNIWLLLSRHFQSRSQNHEENEKILIDITPEESSEMCGFISLYVFDNNGNRVRMKDNPLMRGPYVKSPQTLLKLEAVQNKPYTVVICEQDLTSREHSFSLCVFSSSPLELTEALNEYRFVTSVQSAWNSSTAGGNSEQSTYFINPQFKLTVQRKANVALLLETRKKSINVNLKLVHSNGMRISKLTRQAIIVDSGEYRPNSALADLQDLEAGVYTVVCSTFQAGQEADLILRVDSTTEVELTHLPSELAGRFLIDNLPLVVFTPDTEKAAAPLVPKRLIKFTAIAKFKPPTLYQSSIHSQSKALSPIRISIELGHGPTRKILVVSGSGEYEDSGMGVRIVDVDLWPDMRRHGDVWLVLDRLCAPASKETERFQVEILTDGKLGTDLDIGSWRSWSD